MTNQGSTIRHNATDILPIVYEIIDVFAKHKTILKDAKIALKLAEDMLEMTPICSSDMRYEEPERHAGLFSEFSREMHIRTEKLSKSQQREITRLNQTITELKARIGELESD